MTVALSSREVAANIKSKFPDMTLEVTDQAVIVQSKDLPAVADYLKNSPEMDLSYLTDITAVDYYHYFEVVYRLNSINKNTSLVLKCRCYNRENPEIPSLTSLWRGADFMEREIFDLMGIRFTGHYNLQRLVLWEGFNGYPLRKDYL